MKAWVTIGVLLPAAMGFLGGHSDSALWAEPQVRLEGRSWAIREGRLLNIAPAAVHQAALKTLWGLALAIESDEPGEAGLPGGRTLEVRRGLQDEVRVFLVVIGAREVTASVQVTPSDGGLATLIRSDFASRLREQPQG